MSLYIFKVHSYVAFHSSGLGSRLVAFKFKSPYALLEHMVAIFKGFIVLEISTELLFNAQSSL
jgi:hypothetical protein